EVVRRYVRRQTARLRFCYERELPKKKSLTGTVALDFTIGQNGSVRRAVAKGLDAAVESCLVDGVKTLQFPSPPGSVKVSLPLTFAAPGGVVAQPTKGPPMSRVVLTRLHLRYGKDGAVDDLVFRAAKPLVGGGGLPDDKGKLTEATATVAVGGGDRFQGRYVILHPWTKKLTCQVKTRGAWGGPPDRP